MNALPSCYLLQEVTPQGIPPYFDFLRISKKTKAFDQSQLRRLSNEKFELKKDYTGLGVKWNDEWKTITVWGSIPWFKNGNNLSFDRIELQTAIEDVSAVLDVDMGTAGVKAFEVSKLIPVELSIKEIQDNHRELKDFRRVMDRDTLYWNKLTRYGKRETVLKMYPATVNSRRKSMTVVPSSNLLKFELRLNNPSKAFGYAVTVQDFYSEEIINKAYNAMKHYYSEIEKSLTVVLPESPSTENLILGGLISSSKEPMKEIERLINSCEGLTKQARYKRRQLIRSKLNSLTVEDSKYQLQL